jgi:hypothetical protein
MLVLGIGTKDDRVVVHVSVWETNIVNAAQKQALSAPALLHGWSEAGG